MARTEFAVAAHTHLPAHPTATTEDGKSFDDSILPDFANTTTLFPVAIALNVFVAHMLLIAPWAEAWGAKYNSE
jgi:hypothetical protein